MRPLYLDGNRQWTVTLDGPALSVLADERARARYPLHRLARVVCHRSVSWATDALIACLNAGVPILFLDSRNAPVGWCYGRRRRESTLTELIRLAVDEPDWETRWGDWYVSHERELIAAALRTAGQPCANLGADNARSVLFNAHRRTFGMPFGRHIRAVDGALNGLCLQLLQDEIGDPTLVAFGSPGLHLVPRFSGLLIWSVHGIAQAAVSPRDIDPNPLRFAAQFMERFGDRMASDAGALLGSLERHLRGRLR